jgi:DNA-directed RNA polymerase subunit beta
LEHTDANRALTGSNMQRQAVPLITTSAPYIGTGMEEVVGRQSPGGIFAKDDGEVLYEGKAGIFSTEKKHDQ